MRICDHWSTDPSWLPFEPRRIVSVYGPPWLYFEPLKLLIFYFDADVDPDPAFYSHSIRVLLPKIKRIRIRNPAFSCDFGPSLVSGSGSSNLALCRTPVNHDIGM
jgi:hypothetical protein